MKVQEINFKGYKNVISTTQKLPDGKISLLSMQLNNIGYYKDLDKWHSIQKKLFPDKPLKDTVSLVHVTQESLGVFSLLVNNFPISINKHVQNVNEENEAPVFKFYALLKSIVQRIHSGEKGLSDSERTTKLLPELIGNFSEMNMHPKNAADLISYMMTSRFSTTQEVAAELNNVVEDLMDGYVDNLANEI